MHRCPCDALCRKYSHHPAHLLSRLRLLDISASMSSIRFCWASMFTKRRSHSGVPSLSSWAAVSSGPADPALCCSGPCLASSSRCSSGIPPLRLPGLADKGALEYSARWDRVGGLCVGNLRMGTLPPSAVAPWCSARGGCGPCPTAECVRMRRGAPGFSGACIDVSLRRVAGP